MRESQNGIVVRSSPDETSPGERYNQLTLSVPGSWSEYAKCAEYFVALKPETLSFADASALPLAAVTALQALRKYKGSLSGKTVFVPAGRKLSAPPRCLYAWIANFSCS
jgi:NADPH:quinone reductase-like Zn-dependent oxidoreductase